MAGRPPKVAPSAEQVKQAVEEATVVVGISKAEQENIELKQKMAEMMTMIEQMSKTQVQPQVIIQQAQSNIPRSVKVMSLVPNFLSLTTEARGGGIKYFFSRFGQCEDIPFDHLALIKKVAWKHLEAGVFYICDEQAVESLFLTDLYKKLVNKDAIDKIVNLTTDNDIEIFRNLSKSMQEVIVDMIVQNTINEQIYDLNRISQIERITGISISQKVADIKANPKLNK